MTKRYSIYLPDDMVEFLKKFTKIIEAKKIQTAIKMILKLFKEKND